MAYVRARVAKMATVYPAINDGPRNTQAKQRGMNDFPLGDLKIYVCLVGHNSETHCGFDMQDQYT